MAATKIEWATHAWNPVTGCTPVSPGCANCYAKRMANRLKGRFGYPQDSPFRPGTVHAEALKQPSTWKAPRRIFVCSMGDLFHEAVPFELINEIYNAIPKYHKALVLTKRIERAAEFYQWLYDETVKYDAIEFPFDECLGHIWLGVTVCTQEEADEKIPILKKIPSPYRFLSIEPMLEEIDLTTHLLNPGYWAWHECVCDEIDPSDRPCFVCAYQSEALDGIDWVIVGGESGTNARPMNPAWAMQIRDRCKASKTPFFFKQQGEWVPDDNIVDVVLWGPQRTQMKRVGKAAAGHLLDGELLQEFPVPLHLPGEGHPYA